MSTAADQRVPCPLCGQMIMATAVKCRFCGEQVKADPALEAVAKGDGTGGLIPYKNPQALTAYYLSIASLLCCPVGIVAVILGFRGLSHAKKHPETHGTVHAWIGIILGSLTTLAFLAVIGMFVFALIMDAQR